MALPLKIEFSRLEAFFTRILAFELMRDLVRSTTLKQLLTQV